MAGDSIAQNPEPSDSELLRQYAVNGSEAAIATLVGRHLGLVYNVALRKVGADPHLAEDVTQRVFADLASKAISLQRHAHLTGWLFISTHYTAAHLVRTERRRKAYEQKACEMNELLREAIPSVEWERLRPLLDDLVLHLSERDREAVLLRYFEGLSFAELGVRLRLTDHGARARVERAVDKLRSMLARRGITSTSAALGVALAGQATAGAPAALAANVTGSALAAAASFGTLTGLIGFMNTTKIVAVGATLVAIAAVGFGVNERLSMRTATTQIAALRQERAAFAAKLAAAEQRIKENVSAPIPAGRKTAPEPSPLSAESARGSDPSSASLAATKEVFAIINMAGPQRWMRLDNQHVVNMRTWIEHDPSGLIRWIGTLPSEKQREHTTEAVIAVATEADPEFAFLLTNAIVRDVPRSNRRHEVMRAWAERDSLAAARAVNNANLAEKDRQQLLLTIAKSSGKR